MSDPILLFDGVCNLCAGAVRFVLRHERQGSRLKFGSLESQGGRALLERFQLRPDYRESLVFIENGKAYTGSTAALRVAGYLRFPYSLFKLKLVIPRLLREPVYAWIARNRYRWFGKKDACWLPTPELAARFIDAGRRP